MAVAGNRISFSARNWDDITAQCDKVKVVHVLSEEQNSCFEYGFITADLIKKYCGGACSVFMCGPAAMYTFVGKELEKLSMKRKLIRLEMLSAPVSPAGIEGYPGDTGKEFTLTVKRYGETLARPYEGGRNGAGCA